jgi:hypothetical protein
MPSRTRLRSGDAAALGFTTIAARLQDMVVSHSEPQRATASHSGATAGRLHADPLTYLGPTRECTCIIALLCTHS